MSMVMIRKSRFKRDLLTVFILCLVLFGGMQFYLSPTVLRTGIIIGFGLLAWAGWLLLRGAKIPFAPSLFWLAAAVGISVGVNWDIYQAGLGRVFLYAVAGSVLVIANYYLNEKQIYAGIYRAGWVWGIGWPVFYGLGFLYPIWLGNHNVWGFWSVVFVAVGLYQTNRWYIVPHLVALLFFTSRGAIIGTAVVFVVAVWPVLLRSKYVLALSSPFVILAGLWLFWWRPATALVRLHYWRSAWAAFAAVPVFGVGPGGLKARQLITEMGGMQFQIHAHNSFISWIAETGLIGLAALGIAIYSLLNTQYSLNRWQLAALAGIAAHSIVDEPLWWPGPLLMATIIISAKDVHTP